MDLKEFVSSSLVQIAEGIAEAQAKAADIGLMINPALVRAGELTSQDKRQYGDLPVHDVEFDVAVTVREEKGSGGKAGVGISVVHASIGGKLSTEDSSVSHIKFLVPVRYPDPRKDGR